MNLSPQLDIENIDKSKYQCHGINNYETNTNIEILEEEIENDNQIIIYKEDEADYYCRCKLPCVKEPILFDTCLLTRLALYIVFAGLILTVIIIVVLALAK